MSVRLIRTKKNVRGGIIRKIANTPDKGDEVSWIFDQSMSSQSRATNCLQAFAISISKWMTSTLGLDIKDLSLIVA